MVATRPDAPPEFEQRDGFLYQGNVPFALDRDLGWRAKIGLIVLDNDWTIEYEVSRILALEGVAVYAHRIHMDEMVTMETLRAMEPRITAAAAMLNPATTLDVVAYGCTSGTIAIGKEQVFQRIREVKPGVACTTPIVAGAAGMKALGMRRIALLTPYVEDVTLGMRDYLLGEGLEVPVVGTFNNPVDAEVAHITRESIVEAAVGLGREAVDGVFVSCTELPATAVIEEAEGILGKPVLASNQALAWHALRLAGVSDAVPGWGRLLRV